LVDSIERGLTLFHKNCLVTWPCFSQWN